MQACGYHRVHSTTITLTAICGCLLQCIMTVYIIPRTCHCCHHCCLRPLAWWLPLLGPGGRGERRQHRTSFGPLRSSGCGSEAQLPR